MRNLRRKLISRDRFERKNARRERAKNILACGSFRKTRALRKTNFTRHLPLYLKLSITEAQIYGSRLTLYLMKARYLPPLIDTKNIGCISCLRINSESRQACTQSPDCTYAACDASIAGFQLVEISYAADSTKSVSLLEKRNKRWGGRNYMQLGYIGHLRTFIASKTVDHEMDCGHNESMNFCYRSDMPGRGEHLLAAWVHPAALVRLPHRHLLPLPRLDSGRQIHGRKGASFISFV